MNYRKIYNTIIFKRLENPPDSGYVERHHIIPKALGGTDDKFNLVCLTPREHYLCHWLLVKIQPAMSPNWYKMVRAFNNMSRTNSIQGRTRINSRLFKKGRELLSITVSKSQKGSGNSQYGKRYVHNEELRQCFKTRDWKKYVAEGWKLGRVLNWDLFDARRHVKLIRALMNSRGLIREAVSITNSEDLIKILDLIELELEKVK